MKAIVDSLVGRAILVMLAGVLTVQLSSLWIYETTITAEASLANQERLVERLVSIYHSVGLLPQDAREPAAHDLSGGVIEAHWSARPRTAEIGSEEWSRLRDQLAQKLPVKADDDVRVGQDSTTGQQRHLAMISIRLPDSSWLNVGILAPHFHPPRPWQAIIATTIVAVLVALVSILMVRWLGRPLQRIAETARRFQVAGAGEIIPEQGPREVRELASALNEMQARIVKHTRARTQALAAVSHDLKTPLTRARLRIEDLSDRQLRESLEHDFTEMERMIEATLNYLRGDRSGEEIQSVELVALISTILDEASDMGQTVSLIAPNTVVLRGRRMALKRALTNIVQNAIKYGGQWNAPRFDRTVGLAR